ncbi:hypothetical protein AALD22_19760 [Lachnospiraceae bacterium 56-18]
MSGEDILALVIAVTLVIIILVVISILLYKRCQNLYIENRMLHQTIEKQAKLDELSFAAQQAMINEALRASRNNN